VTRIDLATGDDAVCLRELHVLTWAATYASLLDPAFCRERLHHHHCRDWKALIRDQRAGGGGVLVARAGDGVRGLCQYGPSEDDDERPGNVGHIHRLYVRPAAQRQGVGRALLQAATERLVQLDLRDLTLWALEDDPRARAFYERLGWRPDGARRFDGAWDVRYRKHATSAFGR
jgi:GNAT superfamily N-acetyltransferase